jgi:SAM-dependent methyltransferase
MNRSKSMPRWNRETSVVRPRREVDLEQTKKATEIDPTDAPTNESPSALDSDEADAIAATPAAKHKSAKIRLSSALAGDIIAQHAVGARILGIGGDRQVWQWFQARTSIPLSEIAAETLLDAELQASDAAEEREPIQFAFPDNSFDLVFILNVFSHLGRDEESSTRAAGELLAEAARVVAPGGRILVHYFNPLSLKGLKAGIRKGASIISLAFGSTVQSRMLTRWDHPLAFYHLVPLSCEIERLHGLDSLFSALEDIHFPLFTRWLVELEWSLRDRTSLVFLSGEILAVLRKGQAGPAKALDVAFETSPLRPEAGPIDGRAP